MSLINQALRKAQRDRTPKRMPKPGDAAPGSSFPTGSGGMKPGLLIGLVVAVAVLFGLVVGLTLTLFKGNDSRVVAQQTPANPEQTAAQQATPTSSAGEAPAGQIPIESVTPQTASSRQAPLLERGTEPAVLEELERAREAAEAKASAEAKAAEAAETAAARAAAEPSQEAIDWLSRAQVSGVMLAGAKSKVILNGKPYAVGEYVNFALGLKVLIIQEKRVLFVDKNGKKYLKRL